MIEAAASCGDGTSPLSDDSALFERFDAARERTFAAAVRVLLFAAGLLLDAAVRFVVRVVFFACSVLASAPDLEAVFLAAVVLAAVFVALLFAVVVDFVLLSVDVDVVFRVRLAAGFFALASIVVASTDFVLAVEAVFALVVDLALVFGASFGSTFSTAAFVLLARVVFLVAFAFFSSVTVADALFAFGFGVGDFSAETFGLVVFVPRVDVRFGAGAFFVVLVLPLVLFAAGLLSVDSDSPLSFERNLDAAARDAFFTFVSAAVRLAFLAAGFAEFVSASLGAASRLAAFAFSFEARLLAPLPARFGFATFSGAASFSLTLSAGGVTRSGFEAPLSRRFRIKLAALRAARLISAGFVFSDDCMVFASTGFASTFFALTGFDATGFVPRVCAALSPPRPPLPRPGGGSFSAFSVTAASSALRLSCALRRRSRRALFLSRAAARRVAASLASSPDSEVLLS